MIKRGVKTVFCFLYFCLIHITPKISNRLVFISYPDCSDNAYALFRYLVSTKKDYQYIWLVADVDWSSAFLKENHPDLVHNNQCRIVKKHSLLALYLYLSAKYIFFTHGTYWFARSGYQQKVINLWHGMPLKKIGLLDGKSKSELYFCHYTLATSQLFQNVVSQSFGLPPEQILITGLPRNDVLFDDDLKVLNFSDQYSYNKLVLWMPTYRISNVGEVRSDTDLNASALPLLKLAELEELNLILREEKILLVIKLHPMDILNENTFLSFSNIYIIDNNVMKEKKYVLYQLLKTADALVTDYSSVFIDYLLLKRPIAFIIDDIEKYKRGFSLENVEDILPGMKIKEKIQLFDFFKNLAENSCHQEMDLMNDNEVKNGLASERLVNIIGLS